MGGFLSEGLLGVSRAVNSLSEGIDVAKDGWKELREEAKGCAGEDKLCSEVTEPPKDDLPANRSMLS